MAEDRIDSIIDRPKVQADVDFLAGKIKDVRTLLDILRKKNLSIFNATSVKEFTNAAKQVEMTTRQLQKAVDDLSKAQDRNSRASLNEAKAEKELATARERNARAAKVEQQLTKEVTKTKDQLNKAALKEIDNLAKLNSSYEQLKQKYKVAANTAKELGAATDINNREFQQAAAAAQGYYQKLLAIEQAVGQSQRQVGNYTQATFALTQVLREAPAFANSFATGISAIGNNVPILTDQIKKLREAGLSSFQVFKVLAGSLLSFNAILPIGFLLIQSYGKEISTFFKNLFNGNKVLKDSEKNWQAYNAALDGTVDSTKDAIAEVEDMRQILKLAKGGVIDKEKALKFYNETIGKTTGAVKTLKEAEDELIKNGPAYIRINLLKALSSQLSADAAKEVAEKQKEIQRLEEINNTIRERIAQGDYKDVFEFETLKSAISINENVLQTITQNEGDKILDRYQQMITRVNGGLAKLAKDNNFNLTNLFGLSDDKDDDKARREAERRAEEEAKKAEERRKFIFEAQKALIEDRRAANEIIRDDENKDYTVRLGALRNFIAASIELINLEADFEKGKKNITAEEVQKIEAEKQADLNELNRTGTAERNKILDAEYKAQAEAAQKDKADQDKIDLDKFNARNKRVIAFGKFIEDQLKKQQKAYDEASKKEEETDRKKAELKKQLAREVTETLKALAVAEIEDEKNRIQEQIDALDLRKEQEIEAATATIANAQERAAAIAVIEARANAQREALQRRQRQLDQQRARFEKAANVAKIISDTAAAIIATLKQTPPPAGIPLAALVGAIGAAQLVRVVATPIPKYAKGTGTGKHPGGLAIVGDGGKSEMMVTPDGLIYKTPSTDTLVDAPAGTVVYPDYEKAFAEAMTARSYKSTPSQTGVNFLPVISTLRESSKENIMALKALERTVKHNRKIPSVSDRFIQQTAGQSDWMKMNGVTGW